MSFPSLAAQINFFQPKEKGRSKLKRLKTKETSKSPKLRSKLKRRKRENDVLFDNPAMGTRSKKVDPGSPAMSTRSKRRLSL